MFDRIYKFLKSSAFDFLSYVIVFGCFFGGALVGAIVAVTQVGQKTNHCEQQLELVKQGAKQGVHEFLAEFGLEYRKKK